MSDKISPSEAVYGFAAWLSTSQDSITTNNVDDHVKLFEKVKYFCEYNNLESPSGGSSGVCYPLENVEETTEVQSVQPQKHAAPLENAKGLSWFDGTSWGTK